MATTGISVGEVFAFLPDAALVVDADGRIRRCNRLAEELFGYDGGGLDGRAVEELIPDRFRPGHEKLRRGYASEARARSMGAGIDLFGLRSDGSEFPVDVSLAPVDMPEGRFTVAIVRDLSSRLAAAEAERRLLAEVQRQRDWLEAVRDIQQAVLREIEAREALALVAERAGAIAQAAGVAITLPGDLPSTTEVVVATGDLESLASVTVGAESSLAGRVYSSGRPFESDDLSTSSEMIADAVRGVAMGPVIIVPMSTPDGPVGALSVVRRPGDEPFAGGTKEAVTTFAQQAAIALELSRARSARESVALLSERDRIARDLHDHVIQRIFATGLGLQAAAGRVTDPLALERINHAVDELDVTIRELRTSIFELESRPTAAAESSASLREQLLEIASRAAEGLGFHPAVRFSGAVDLRIGPAMRADVLAVAREGLSNVAKYAHARSAEVSVVVNGGLTVTVLDDGRGIGKPKRSSGLDNLRSRAVAHGGAMTVGDRETGGTSLVWQVPLGVAT